MGKQHVMGFALSVVLAVLGVGACSNAVSNDCLAVASNGGDGGVSLTTSSSTGGDSRLLCGCVLPEETPSGCRVPVRQVNGDCEVDEVPNGLPCRGGVGVCQAGICAAPNWPAQCLQGVGDPTPPICGSDGDCDDKNPCTKDSCPSPGCEACLHVPLSDLTDCTTDPNSTQVCRQGACCDLPPNFP
jgi:hypothetical protein